MNSEPAPAARLLSVASGYMQSRAFLTAHDLGVFAQLAIGPQTAAAISTAIDTDTVATQMLLDALTALGILTRRDGLYALCEELATSLDPNHPDYIGGTLEHLSRLWDSWSGLTRIVESGRRGPGERTEEMRMGLALAMQHQARQAAPRLAAFVDGSKVNTMLDLGGGPGAYCIAFVKRHPHIRAVLLDHDDQALELARSDIQAAGLQDRIQLRKADFLAEDIGSGYDLVLLSSVLSVCSEQQNRLLLEKVHRSLNPGGLLLVRDHMLDGAEASSGDASLFSICMLVGTAEGRVYSLAESKSWLRELGFEAVHHLPVDHMCLLVGRKANG